MLKRRTIRFISWTAVGGAVLATAWIAVQPQKPIKSRHFGRTPYPILFSDDGSIIVCGSVGRELNILDGRTLNTKLTIYGFKNAVFPLAVSPDGALIAAGESHDHIDVIDTTSGARVRRLAPHADEIISVAFSPNGKYLATGGRDKVAILWDAHTGKVIRKLWGHKNIVGRVVFTPDGKSLITDDFLWFRFWDLESGKLIRKRNTASYLWKISKDGRFGISRELNSTVAIWDATFTNARQIDDSNGRGVDISDTGQLVTAINESLTVRSLQSGAVVRKIQIGRSADSWPHVLLWLFPFLKNGRTPRVMSMAVTRDGSRVAVSTDDGYLKLWKAN